MNINNKKIIVISGVTGAIGSALFAEYGKDSNNVIYGISRKARPISDFLRQGRLPLRTLICSINGDYESLFSQIDYQVGEVIYIHALGLYPFEVNSNGQVEVQNDGDGDGVNDDVTRLTFHLFKAATTSLQKNWRGKTICMIFAGIADKYCPAVHQSWWRTIKRVKKYMTSEVSNNNDLSMVVCNISSVMCPHEVITRPFVFTDTDADQTYWLHPYDLATYIVENLNSVSPGLIEIEKYNKRPGFTTNYYKDENFTPRKVRELF